MRRLIEALLLSLLAGCVSHNSNISKEVPLDGWARFIEDRSISRFMESSVDAVAQGPDDEWNQISEIWTSRRLDGIAATCFSVGLGELFARSPTVFLERHLAGDVTAKELAREGYNLLYSEEILKRYSFDADKARANAVNMFNQRKSMEEGNTRRKIEEFILFVTDKTRA